MITLALVLPAVQVCRDWAFIDRNTGSRKGYRDWIFGWRSGSWYQESTLEAFMRSKHPAELHQEWVSYAGTGRNVFGGAILHGHGRPGPIILLKPEIVDDYCLSASDEEKRHLYDLFAGGQDAKIRELVDRIYEEVMAENNQKTDPDGAGNGSQPIRSEGNSK